MTAPPRLAIRDLRVVFGGVPAVDGVDLNIAPGETVALLGPNGAGKSTLLAAVVGLVPAHAGTLLLDGADLSGLATGDRVRAGIGYAGGERRVFPGLTVRENLEVAIPGGRAARRRRLGEIMALFPALAERAGEAAWGLSGGLQQMVAIGRALAGRPGLLLLDEPVAGLAPAVAGELASRLGAVARAGASILLVEQDEAWARGLADRVVFLEAGRTRAGLAGGGAQQ